MILNKKNKKIEIQTLVLIDCQTAANYVVYHHSSLKYLFSKYLQSIVNELTSYKKSQAVICKIQ